MTDLEKQLKRIADLLEYHLGDTDPVLPDDQDVLEDEFPVHAAMQFVVELMLAARATAEQSRDSVIEECAAAIRKAEFSKQDDEYMTGMEAVSVIRALKSQQDAGSSRNEA